MTRRAVAGPTPSSSCRTRNQPDLVVRVLQHPQQGEQVLHVGGLQELQAAVLHERDVPAGELDLEQVAVVAGPEQDRLAAAARRPRSRCSRTPRRPRRPARPRRGRSASTGRAPPGRADHSVFVVALRRQGDHGVGASRIGWRGAVVLLQRDHRGAGELVGEVEDVAHGRRAEPVDGLRVVADHGEVPSTRRPHRRAGCRPGAALVSWYSSTRTWSNARRPVGPRLGGVRPAPASTAAGRRSRGRSAARLRAVYAREHVADARRPRRRHHGKCALEHRRRAALPALTIRE